MAALPRGLPPDSAGEPRSPPPAPPPSPAETPPPHTHPPPSSPAHRRGRRGEARRQPPAAHARRQRGAGSSVSASAFSRAGRWHRRRCRGTSPPADRPRRCQSGETTPPAAPAGRRAATAPPGRNGTARHGTAPPAAPRAAPREEGAAALGGRHFLRTRVEPQGSPPPPPRPGRRTVPAHTAPHARDRGAPGADTVPEGFPPPLALLTGVGLTRPLPAAVSAEKTLNSGGTNFFWFFWGVSLEGESGCFTPGRVSQLHPLRAAGTRSPVGSIPSPPHPEGPQSWAWQADRCQGCDKGLPPARGLSGAHPKPTGERLRGERLQLCFYL